MRLHLRSALIVVLVVAGLGALSLGGCGKGDETGGGGTTVPATTAGTTPGSGAPGSTSTTGAPPTTASPTTAGPTTGSPTTGGVTTTAPTTKEITVEVFFVRDELVATAGRSAPVASPARGAIEALLAGPGSVETGAGMTTAVPSGVSLLGIDIAGGTATVDLTGNFASGGGSHSMQERVAQIVFTLTQFGSVGRVTFHLDGRAVDSIGGEGVPAQNLTRADFTDVTPVVLVESPLPGATVRSPFVLSGTSNTFEATVNWKLLDRGGATVAEGSTTATAGTGTWGTFRTPVAFGAVSGAVTLRAFEVSARDGTPIHEYDVPLTAG